MARVSLPPSGVWKSLGWHVVWYYHFCRRVDLGEEERVVGWRAWMGKLRGGMRHASSRWHVIENIARSALSA